MLGNERLGHRFKTVGLPLGVLGRRRRETRLVQLAEAGKQPYFLQRGKSHGVHRGRRRGARYHDDARNRHS